MKTLLITVAFLVACAGHAANPAFTDFITNQFDVTGNKVRISPSAVVTNNTIITTNLTVLNSLTVSNIITTNITIVNNLTTSNLFYITGKGNTLIITNNILMPWTTLAFSGASNVTANLTNSMFALTLTNNAFFTAPSSLPGTTHAQTIQIHLKQDGTGARTIMMTNGSWIVSGSSAAANASPTINTNANGITILTFATSPFSATLLYGVPTVFTP